MFAPPGQDKLGNRFTCFQCGTKFYDLGREDPICPDSECSADQRNAPARDLKALFGSSKARRPAVEEEVEKPDESDDEDEDKNLVDDFMDGDDKTSGDEDED